MKRRVPALLAASALALGTMSAAPAANAKAAGEDSLAALLTSDGNQFDKAVSYTHLTLPAILRV